MNLISFEEILDEHLGKIGTPRRDEHERRVAAMIEAMNEHKKRCDEVGHNT